MTVHVWLLHLGVVWIIPEPHFVVHIQVYAIVLDDKVNEKTLDKFEKLGDMGEKIENIEQLSKVKRANQIG